MCCNEHWKYTSTSIDYHSAPASGRKYENVYNHDTFDTNKLACAVDNYALAKTESTYGKLTTVVTYRTCYIEKNGKQALLPIVLGNGV